MAKAVLMQAQVGGQPAYRMSGSCTFEAMYSRNPDDLAGYWVEHFIHCLAKSTGFVREKVTFTLFTHGGAHTHRMVAYFDAESADDLKAFWIPVITKYILEN